MTDIEIPPAPATVEEAKRQANDRAYGFEKHTGDYWNALYAKDPDYAWKRMLGWQAGGDDVARYGLYAVPPSLWHGASVDPPAIPPVDPPAPPSADAAVLARLDQLEAQIADVKGLILAIAQRPAPTYTGQVAIPAWLGTGRVTLTPKAAE